MSNEMGRTIYGDRARYAILEIPDATVIPPAKIDRLPMLGTHFELFTYLNRAMTQAEIAERFATSQQSISRYINDQAFPLFSPREWLLLIGLYLDALDGLGGW